MATITKTVKSTGGDYSSLSDWEAGRQGDLVSAGNIEQAEVYAFEDTSELSISGWTTSTTCYPWIYAPSSERHSGEWSDSKARLFRSNGAGIYIDAVYSIRIEGYQIHASESRNAYNGSSCVSTIWGGQFEDVRFIKCIFRTSTAAYGDGGNGAYLNSGSSGHFDFCVFENCIFYNSDTNGWSRRGIYSETMTSDHNLYVYNCTFKNHVYPLSGNGGDYFVKNCGFISCDNGIQEDGGNWTKTTNSTSTPTMADGQSFHLSSSDTTWKDQGTDLHEDSGYSFSDDIDGATRSGTWDIGADEYTDSALSLGAHGSPTITMEW